MACKSSEYDPNYVRMKLAKTVDHDVQTRPWIDLPPELLSTIADRLGLIELLCFRGVCKSWRHASSTASAQIESAKKHKPSFLLYGAHENCNFYYKDREKPYSINIPELENSICIASNHGWLLLAQSQEQASNLFFFCPFSRGMIQLPQFPQSGLSDDHVASFSAPPTSPDCILAIAYRTKDRKIEFHRIQRGDQTWTTQEFNFPHIDTLRSGVYDAKTKCFYFADNDKGIFEFSTKEQASTPYTLTTSDKPGIKTLQFSYQKDKLKDQKGLVQDDNIWISTCGTTYFLNNYKRVIENEKIEPPSVVSPEGSCSGTHKLFKGVWIHPRFHQIPPHQAW